MIARIVHESNRQEDLYLSLVRTRELADAAFDEPIGIRGPHLDMIGMVSQHKDAVIRMKRDGKSKEELAAYNLSIAHRAIKSVVYELVTRFSAGTTSTIITSIRAIEDAIEGPLQGLKDLIQRHTGESVAALTQLLKEQGEIATPPAVPLSQPITTLGELLNALAKEDREELLRPMRVDYIHLFHRLTTMGLVSPSKCGVFRRGPVHLEGNSDLVFPVWRLIDSLMGEFCGRFPAILPNTVKYDPILAAAEVSHRFVAIHPYADGNGRVSRILMNLILWLHYPPVYLRADANGKHRYHQALRRADNGNIKPLACLIAISLKDIYRRLLASVTPP